jgi:hypothetical protein
LNNRWNVGAVERLCGGAASGGTTLGLATTVLEVPSLRGASPSEELDSFELVSGQRAYWREEER